MPQAEKFDPVLDRRTVPTAAVRVDAKWHGTSP
jgi:hypothetical protein